MDKFLADQIAGIAEEDARALFMQLRARFDGKADPSGAFDADETNLWNAVATAYGKATGGRRNVPTLKVFVKTFGRARYAECALMLADTVDLGCNAKESVRRPQRQAMEELLMTLLVRWMQSRSMIITPTTLCLQMHNLKLAADREFPGYIDAGAFYRVAQGAV